MISLPFSLPSFFFLPFVFRRSELTCRVVVVALAPLAQDETVLALPRASVLSVANSELFEKLREELSTLDSWLVCFSPHLAILVLFIYDNLSYPIYGAAVGTKERQEKKERKKRKKESVQDG